MKNYYEVCQEDTPEEMTIEKKKKILREPCVTHPDCIS